MTWLDSMVWSELDLQAFHVPDAAWLAPAPAAPPAPAALHDE